MGLALKIVGARFDSDRILGSLRLPVMSGLTSEFLFGTDLASSSRNIATNLTELTEIAPPDYYPNYVFINTSVVNTGLLSDTSSSADNTFIVLCQPYPIGDASIVKAGTFTFGGTASNATINFTRGTYTGKGLSALPRASWGLEEYGILIGRGGVTGLATLDAGINGVLTRGTVAGVEGASILAPIQFGGDDGLNLNGHTNLVYFASYNKILTDAECQKTYQYLKSYFEDKGIFAS